MELTAIEEIRVPAEASPMSARTRTMISGGRDAALLRKKTAKIGTAIISSAAR